ncbi:MAG TPA: Holliday junction branch migration protein RuvA [Dehalococcoidales bacterium]|nr:Holliday junction branch migration protein RuvA [Dehalococcoidales bacterium]
MIASLQGKVESLGSDGAIINVGGVGYYVYMPTTALSSLATPGHDVRVFTHLHVREDNLSLYGFPTAEELWLFETLLGVTGLGPKLALAMLSALNPEQITTAIATGSIDMLDMIPGIGKKVASRIILELKEKIVAGWVAAPASEVARENTDVLAALTSLGYSPAETVKAVASLPADRPLDLEEKIKLALQYFGSR